uniref:Tau-tubulin kinase 1 n=1 Tax=Ascaris suum TaxID=6253 RepID=F1L4M2_ASCSU
MAAQNAPAAPPRPSPVGQTSDKEAEQKSVRQRRSIIATLLRSTKKKAKRSIRPERYSKRKMDEARRMATKDLSCVKPAQRRTTSAISAPMMAPTSAMRSINIADEGSVSVDEKHALAEHLRSIAPFNKRWQVTETINEGTYGVVFAVKDVETGVRGVIKVAKSVGDDAGNQTAEWEAFILEKIYNQNPNASIVRLLDKGVLADQNGEAMQFMVLEKAEIAILDYLNEFTGIERKLKVTQASLQLLKGIHDMHREGLLHRDLKPDNMGILSREQPFVVLFDLGMTRMYTDELGQIRVPRTTCPFRGTPEWASGWAQKGREQSRFDDLIGWLYVCCELYDSSPTTVQPLPWTYRRSNKILALLKTNHCPAFILLNRAPRQFYAINTYLMSVNRNTTPNYRFIADKLKQAIDELEIALRKEKGTAASMSKPDVKSTIHPKSSRRKGAKKFDTHTSKAKDGEKSSQEENDFKESVASQIVFDN